MLQGIEAEVLDLRVLRPLDTTAILESVSRTRRCVIVDEAWRSGSISAEIGMRIAESAFFELDAPLRRVCGREVPMPYAAHLEDACLPQPEGIAEAARELVSLKPLRVALCGNEAWNADGDGVPDYLDKCPDTPRGTKVDATGCPIAPVATTFDLTVEFAFNSAEINDLSFRELRKAMTFMRENPTTKAVVEGNTDNKGTDAYNQKLSERRAASVKDVLVKSGIEADRLTTVGYGESRPVASNDTEEGRAKNRRVSIVVK